MALRPASGILRTGLFDERFVDDAGAAHPELDLHNTGGASMLLIKHWNRWLTRIWRHVACWISECCRLSARWLQIRRDQRGPWRNMRVKASAGAASVLSDK